MGTCLVLRWYLKPAKTAEMKTLLSFLLAGSRFLFFFYSSPFSSSSSSHSPHTDSSDINTIKPPDSGWGEQNYVLIRKASGGSREFRSELPVVLHLIPYAAIPLRWARLQPLDLMCAGTHQTSLHIVTVTMSHKAPNITGSTPEALREALCKTPRTWITNNFRCNFPAVNEGTSDFSNV